MNPDNPDQSTTEQAVLALPVNKPLMYRALKSLDQGVMHKAVAQILCVEFEETTTSSTVDMAKAFVRGEAASASANHKVQMTSTATMVVFKRGRPDLAAVTACVKEKLRWNDTDIDSLLDELAMCLAELLEHGKEKFFLPALVRHKFAAVC